VRIAFLTTEYGDLSSERGGLGYHLARTVPLLVSCGHSCDVFLSAGKSNEGQGSTLIANGARIHVVSAPEPTPFDDLALPDQVKRHLRSAWALAEALSATHQHAPYDVIQAPNYGLSGLFVDVAAPLVMRFSSHAPTWHREGGAPHDLRAILTEILQRRSIERSDAHFAPSSFVADLFGSELGLSVQVVRPPMPAQLDRSNWDAAWAEQVAGGRTYLVHAGQLGRAKGTDLTLEAVDRCLADKPELELHLCGRDAGAGERVRRSQTRFPGRVHYHGRVPRERLLPLMEGALAVLCPSRADNLPNVAIEAMGLGVPVVGLRGASVDELVVDGESGVLARSGDADALTGAVRSILSQSGPRRMAMRTEARSRVLGLLDAESSVRDLIDFYTRAARCSVRRRSSRHEAAAHVRADLLALNQISPRPDRRPNWKLLIGLLGGRRWTKR